MGVGGSTKDQGLRVETWKEGRLCVSIGVETLAKLGELVVNEAAGGDAHRWRVTDPFAFAQAVAHRLFARGDDGETPARRMLDAAMIGVVEREGPWSGIEAVDSGMVGAVAWEGPGSGHGAVDPGSRSFPGCVLRAEVFDEDLKQEEVEVLPGYRKGKDRGVSCAFQPPPWRPEVELSDGDVEFLFSYHVPSAAKAERFARINEASMSFARTLRACLARDANRTVAVRDLQRLRMACNLAIALGPELDGEGS